MAYIGLIMAIEFAHKLRQLIDGRGITDSAVARAVGVSPTVIGRWTRPVADHGVDADGRPVSVRRPTVPQLLGLARLFGVSMEYLADDGMEESPDQLEPGELAVLVAYRTRRRVEGDDVVTPEEAAWRLSGPVRADRTRDERPSAARDGLEYSTRPDTGRPRQGRVG